MNMTIDNYNKLVPFMNELSHKGIKVDAFHSKNEGYGFYAEADNNHYVNVHIWGDEIGVSLKRHDSHYYHDTLGDSTIENPPLTQDINEVKDLVIKYLDLAKTLSKHYKVDLSETELRELIKCCNQELATKLLKYLN